jgi:hypothetical protein
MNHPMTNEEYKLAALREESEKRPGFRWRDLAVKRTIGGVANRAVRWFLDWTPYYPAKIREPHGDMIAGYYGLPRLGIYAYRYEDGSVGPADRFRKNPPSRRLRRMLDVNLTSAEITVGIDWSEPGEGYLKKPNGR